MSDLNLENIVGFKAVDKNGNERQVTVDEMTELVSARIVSAASEISTFAAAAAAGTDEFEDQLPQSDTFSWLRTLDGSKNPTLTSSSAAAKVLGELVNDTYESFSLESGVETQIAYGTGAYYICGPVSDTLSCIAVVNYYSVATLGVVGGLTFRVTERTLYATSDGSSDIRVKKIRTNS